MAANLMLYTLQLFSESGNYASPDGKDCSHHWSKSSVNATFADWGDEQDRYGYRSDAYARVWRGHIDDVTDAYPDFELRYGPRGGIVWHPC